jgi:hypothetical protein
MMIRNWLVRLLSWNPASTPTPPEHGSSAIPTGGRETGSGRTSANAAAEPAIPEPAKDVLQLPERLRIRTPTRVQRLVYVGIDFGTSGTKVVFRDQLEKERTPYALDFGTNIHGFSRFCFPSSLAIDSDDLILGTEAEMAPPPAVVLRSAKMFLLTHHPRKDGRFEEALRTACGDSAAPSAPYEFAATMLIAEVLRRTQRALEQVYPGIDSDSEINWSIDVPVDHTEPAEAREPFRRALECALLLRNRVHPRMRVEDAVRGWSEALDTIAASPAVEESERRTHVVPEAVAILEGIRDFAPAEWDRNYAVIDIGAGTTDIGIFRVTPLPGNDGIPFFAASTRTVGCDDVDRELCERIGAGGSRDRNLFARVREAKTMLAPGGDVPVQTAGGSARLTYGDLEHAVAHLAPALRGHIQSCFGQAYSLDKHQDRWRNLSTIVVGGGALIEPMRQIFGEQLPNRSFCRVSNTALSDVAADLGLGVAGASQQGPERTDLPFLIPALGMTIPEPLRREYKGPSTIGASTSPRGTSGLYDFDAAEMFD